MDVFDTATPGAAFDAYVPAARERSDARPRWAPGDDPLPALYLSHGAPPLFDDGGWIRDLGSWADDLPHPRAILIVSAHWESAPVSLTSAEAATPLVYDFGGFARRFFTMTYSTPDASALAARVGAALPTAPVATGRGLDHGAWVPLKVMYPGADVPVLQLSLPTPDAQQSGEHADRGAGPSTQDPGDLLALGARLRELRGEGVLVIGSGFMTHGLPYLDRSMLAGERVPGWTEDFDAWAAEALATGDLETLHRYDRAPGMPYAHPSAEHFLPLFVTLGAATDPEAPVTTTIDGHMWGLSRRSFQVA